MPQSPAVTLSRPRRNRVRGARLANQVPDANTPEVNVGRRLRELRLERNLSIRSLAELSGLNVNTFSLIENGKTSPSISTLQQIAAALEVPITAFFETDRPKNSVAHITTHNRPRAAFAHGVLEDLGAGLTNRAVEPFVVTLEPNTSSGPQPIVHTGFEFVFCLQGQLTYLIDAVAYVLEPGDSLLFESHLPHRWQNVKAQPAQAILVLYPTDSRDRPTERHFAVKEP
ncbi:HTH-type transcriptional regulator PuuR [Thermoflexales bacterium]|nr:HTH-type transcriptional regulator PuuR [Thermoflexales bacterium]